ncbi:hypothetical protein [Streptomyces bullii]|uniref:Uncharacterized protein n=1 Tax=Streptomyces bullii TaxID=349910 RepID=A0ABW0UYQ8_9ACTN
MWEAALLAHEREAFVPHVLDGSGPLPARLVSWSADTVDGDVRRTTR